MVVDDKLLIGNVEGKLVRLDLATGNLDNGWSYPREDGLGAIYSDVLVVDGAIYGSGYTCRGDDCDGEVFAVDLIDGFSIWGRIPSKVLVKESSKGSMPKGWKPE